MKYADPEQTLSEIRRENLHGRLYPHPRSHARRCAVESLRAEGKAEKVDATAMSLGGWYVTVRDPH